MADGVGQERRRGHRIKIRASVNSRVFAMLDARLLDLSATGALLEHVEPVRPGGACEVLIGDNAEDHRLRCRIVRSTLTQADRPAAAREIRYQTGVEFVDLRPAQGKFLEGLIRRHGGDGGGTSLAGLRTFFLLF